MGKRKRSLSNTSPALKFSVNRKNSVNLVAVTQLFMAQRKSLYSPPLDCVATPIYHLFMMVFSGVLEQKNVKEVQTFYQIIITHTNSCGYEIE